MSIEIAIIADDLTGALDTSTPLVAAGYRVAAATRPASLAAALASGADVIVVSTASRGLPAPEAGRIARQVAVQLQALRPKLVFKKIDSRLQGNIGVETVAIARAFGLSRAVVAPAVPGQGRFTIAGAVTGRGEPMPNHIAPYFSEMEVEIEIGDAANDAELDAIVSRTDWSHTLAVGARGLGAALARRRKTDAMVPFEPDRQTLFAIGSRDAITAEQVAALSGVVAIHDAPWGAFEGSVELPAVLRCTGAYSGNDEQVARRFAVSVMALVERLQPRILVMSGGDTALTVLDRLGVTVVFPQGEAVSGLPTFLIERASRPSIVAVVKSGGFGNSNSLAALLPRQARRSKP
jgi:uncharacterized protein YgbK (DUF1537 family)